jgi:hypothetical protein
MDSITSSIMSAFYTHKEQKIRSICTIIKGNVTYLYIFDKVLIAQSIKGEKFISITDGGWQSDVAKRLLDAILIKTNSKIIMKNGVWYLKNIKTNALIKMSLNSWHNIPLI